MSTHRLTYFEIPEYYQNEPKLNGVYSRNNRPKVKNVAYNKYWWVEINRNSLDSFVCEW